MFLRSSMLRSASTRLYSSRNFKIFEQNTLESLITDLKYVLSEVTSKDQVDIKTTMNLLRLYDPNEQEWSKYALRDPQSLYTRNLVAHTSPISALLMLVWEPGKSSQIHDHPNSNCFVKVLKGTLNENQYEKVPNSDSLELKRKLEVQTGVVTYITDKIGLHQMENKTNEPVVTLHLYVPNYSQCSIFDNKGAEQLSNDLDYYSIEGEIKK